MNKENIIKQEDIGRSYHISTVKLDTVHYGGQFETMIFKKTEGEINYLDIYCKRYRTEEQSRLGHEEAKAWVENFREEEIQELRIKIKKIREITDEY